VLQKKERFRVTPSQVRRA